MSSTPSSTTLGWHILRFQDVENTLEKDILFVNNPKQSIHDAARDLKGTVFERFGRLGNLGSGDGFGLEALSVVGPDSTEIEVTFSQLVTYIRTLAPSPQATKPDLFGFGSNNLRIKFVYVELYI